MRSYCICSFVFISLSVMFSRSIRVTACVRTLFFKAESYSTGCMYYSLCSHSSVVGHLGCFHLLVTMNADAMNSVVQIHV